MYYVGVDLHKETSWFYILDEKGTMTQSKNILSKPEVLEKYFKKIPKPFTLAVEATYNWYYFIDIAEKYAERVYLSNTYELKAFAKRNKKTDKIDARLIASILHKGFLPTVTIPDRETRGIRELLRHRLSLVRDRARAIVRLKALLDKLGYDSTGDFSTYKRLHHVRDYSLPHLYAGIVTKMIHQIEYFTKTLFHIKKEVGLEGDKDPDIRNLISIPGLNHFSAALIKSEIIDIARFASFNRLCAYAGLAPCVSASAHKIHQGPLNKNRRKNLQWILIENVYHFIKALPEQKEKYMNIKKRKNACIAKIALARDLLKIIYHILKEKRPFYFNKENNKIQSVATAALCRV